jgi:hypothetical protein
MLLEIVGQFPLVRLGVLRGVGVTGRNEANEKHAEDRNNSFHDPIPGVNALIASPYRFIKGRANKTELVASLFHCSTSATSLQAKKDSL